MQLIVPDGVPALAAVAVTSTAVESWVGGVRSIADPTPAAHADHFHLGSNTKAMTATVVARAVEQGRLAWEDDAAVVLGLDAPRGVTIERLLGHTAGMRALTEDNELALLPAERAAVAAVLLGDEPQFEPGTAASYSNGGYAVVAAVLEDVYDAPLEEVLRVELFEPLQLEAGFGWPADLSGHYARGGGLEVHDIRDGYRLPPALTAAGDLNATIDSYGRFVQLHLLGLRGQPQLLDADSFARLHTPLCDGFALGWGVQEWEGARTSVHTGSAETFFVIVALQPERDFGAAAAVNAAGEHAEAAAVEVVRQLIRAHAH